MANEVSSELQTTERELTAQDKHPLEQEGTRPFPIFRPDVDILERSDSYLIHADLPGVDEKNVRVNLDKGVLSLDADLATAPEPGWTALHAEYAVGSYHREFRLTEGIDASGVSATMRDGVLELRLPKSERHQPREIEVQAG